MPFPRIPRNSRDAEKGVTVYKDKTRFHLEIARQMTDPNLLETDGDTARLLRKKHLEAAASCRVILLGYYDSLREFRLRDRNNPRGLQLGDTFVSTDCEGHRRRYTVRGFYQDGTPRTSGWDAPHDDSCGCMTDPEWWG